MPQNQNGPARRRQKRRRTRRLVEWRRQQERQQQQVPGTDSGRPRASQPSKKG